MKFPILLLSTIAITFVACSPKTFIYDADDIVIGPELDWNNHDLYRGELIDTMLIIDTEKLDRLPTFRNTKKVLSVYENQRDVNGIVIINYAINPAGKVFYAEVDRSTTIKSTKALQHMLDAFMLYEFEEDANAPAQQCGQYKFNLAVNRL